MRAGFAKVKIAFPGDSDCKNTGRLLTWRRWGCKCSVLLLVRRYMAALLENACTHCTWSSTNPIIRMLSVNWPNQDPNFAVIVDAVGFLCFATFSGAYFLTNSRLAVK